MEWQVTERDGDLEIRYGGELFGLLPADDRAMLTEESALAEWVEQELLAHRDRLTELLQPERNPEGRHGASRDDTGGTADGP
jgi:hypothetical protein